MTTYNKVLGTIGSRSRDELAALRARIDDTLSADADNEMPPGGIMSSVACRLFTVPEGVRRLARVQVETLTRSFEAWVNESRDKRTRRSRERVYLVFLMLRYTGARLGEVLALNEREHIDFMRCMVTIPGRIGRGQGAGDSRAPGAHRAYPEYCAKYDDYQGPGHLEGNGFSTSIRALSAGNSTNRRSVAICPAICSTPEP